MVRHPGRVCNRLPVAQRRIGGEVFRATDSSLRSTRPRAWEGRLSGIGFRPFGLDQLVNAEADRITRIKETIVTYLLLSTTMSSVDFRRPLEAVIPGAQGRILAVMLRTSGELNLRTVARLAGVSIAQASRVLPGLVDLGMIERREVPPSSLFRLVPEHVATQVLLDLSNVRGRTLVEMGRAAGKIRPVPVSVVAYGSFARGDGDFGSDIDVIIIRSAGVDEDDEQWLRTTDRWRATVGRMSGNVVEVLEADAADIETKLAGKSSLWRDVRRDGIVVFGSTIDELLNGAHA